MTIKPFKLSFYKTPGASSLSLRDAQPIQSTRALAGMDIILKKLSELNQEAYHSARNLDEFTVTLTPIPRSKDHKLQISGKNLVINIAKLKPETKAHFLPLKSALKSPDSSRSSKDTISSMNNSSIFQDPLMLWTMAVSTFRQWMSSLHKLIFGNHVSFSPDTVDGSTSIPKKKNNALAIEKSSEDMAFVTKKQSRLAVEIVDEQRHDFDAPFRPQQNPNYADPELSEESLKTPPTLDSTLKLPSLKDLPQPLEMVYPHDQPSYQKLIPLPNGSKTKNSILIDPKPIVIKKDQLKKEREKDLPPLKILPEPAPIEKPILPAAKASEEEDGFEIVDSSQPEAPAAAQKKEAAQIEDEMLYKAMPLTESKRAEATIISLLRSQFQSSEVQKNAQEEAKPFGLYLFDDVFSKDQLQSCEMDETTGRFKLTFAKENHIPLTGFPKDMSEATKNKLKPALNTTLHIAKELKGFFDYDTGTLELDEGLLTIQWKTWGVRCTAHLLNIKTNPQNAQYLTFKGKFMGMTEDRHILAQDFVNFLECNITEAKRKGLLK